MFENKEISCGKAVAIIGVGNILYGDDGIGPKVIEELAKEPIPDGIDLVDGGSMGVELLDYLAAYRRVIVVDAATMDLPSGEVRVFTPEDVKSVKPDDRISLHSTDILGVIELGRTLSQHMGEIYIVAVEPERIGPAEDLSEEVRASLPTILAEVRRLAAEGVAV